MFTIRFYFEDGSVYQVSPNNVSSWKLVISASKSYFPVVRQLADCCCTSVWIDHRNKKTSFVDETRIYYYEEVKHA